MKIFWAPWFQILRKVIINPLGYFRWKIYILENYSEELWTWAVWLEQLQMYVWVAVLLYTERVGLGGQGARRLGIACTKLFFVHSSATEYGEGIRLLGSYW